MHGTQVLLSGLAKLREELSAGVGGYSGRDSRRRLRGLTMTADKGAKPGRGPWRTVSLNDCLPAAIEVPASAGKKVVESAETHKNAPECGSGAGRLLLAYISMLLL